MYILVEGTKERYNGEIMLSIDKISDDKAELAQELEGKILRYISNSIPKEYCAKAREKYEAAKKSGQGSFLAYEHDEHTVCFDAAGLVEHYTTGCHGVNEYAGETYDIFEDPEKCELSQN